MQIMYVQKSFREEHIYIWHVNAASVLDMSVPHQYVAFPSVVWRENEYSAQVLQTNLFKYLISMNYKF